MRSESLGNVAKRYSLSKGAVYRHKSGCLAEILKKGAEDSLKKEASKMLESIRLLHTHTLYILQKAEAAGRWETALRAIQQARANLELLAKLDGSLKGQDTGAVQIIVSYIDKAIVMPAATAARCIGTGSVDASPESLERTKGEALPLDGAAK